jgi:hypothetical protein
MTVRDALDAHVEPPPELNPQLHQVLVLHDGRIVELRDYPCGEAARAAVGRAT